MKHIIALIFLGLTITTSAQEIVFEKELKLSKFFKDHREAFPITNAADNSLALFLLDDSSIHGFLLDRDLAFVSDLAGERPAGKFSDLLGGCITDGNYNLFFSNKSHKELACLSFNYDTKKIAQSLIELPLTKEHYIGSISYENKLYILTVGKNSSIVKLYILNDGKHYDVKTYDFGTTHFTSDQYYFSLDYALHDETINVIDNEIPNSLDLTSSAAKLYYYDHKIVLTLDNDVLVTRIITIDTNSLQESLGKYPRAKVDCENWNISYNSYIYNNFLYQLKVCNLGMNFSIINLTDSKTVKTFEAMGDQEITFKNTPIIQEKTNGAWIGDSERVLSKTKQFLRKVSSSNAGISAYRIGPGVEITLGGYAQMQQVGGAGSFGPSGSSTMMTPAGAVPVSTYNPTFNSYNSYKSTKSTYIKSLLDPVTFDHQDGIMPQNAFDRIHILLDEIENKITANTIFKKDKDLILGYYVKADHKYIMRKYSDQ